MTTGTGTAAGSGAPDADAPGGGAPDADAREAVLDVDVLIIGAGLSGIGAACHLTRELPGTSYAILEMRERLGGTWDLFRYPGVRSDSDMYTLGYGFRPWRGRQALADGPSILRYIEDTAGEYDVLPRIRYGHKVVRADWSSGSARWTVTSEGRDATGEPRTATATCRFLYCCTGYYDYTEGYTPHFPGIGSYTGQVVHPQFWPEGLPYAGKRVVVIGSGATAITLVPAMAAEAAHVTMLQRTPTYVLNMPSADPVADLVQGRLPQRAAYLINRWNHLLQSWGLYRAAQIAPGAVRRLIRRDAKSHLPQDFPIDVHFNPPYDPWDQRLCLVPDADLYRAIRMGRAEVVTDTIDTFTPTGIRLTSGRELCADVVVTATGLKVLPGGGATLSIDGADVYLRDTVSYKGIMLSGIPNFALALGYTNASWTLKVDLVSRYICRLLAYMERHGFDEVRPLAPPATEARRPIIDFAAGYVQRADPIMPRQGTRGPWRLPQNYLSDRARLRRRGRLDDGVVFTRRADRVAVKADVDDKRDLPWAP